MQTARAWLSISPGGPDSLQLTTRATPRPAAGEVLIEVKACGVNYFDYLIIQDLYQLKPPRPFAPGAEWAGVISEIGEGVSTWRVGDHVLGAASFGGLAETVALKATTCRPLPNGMSFIDGAGYQTAFGTAYYSLRERGALQSGEALLVLGAAGGMGAAAIQLGAARGARVLAVVSSPEKAAFALAQGAADTLVLPHDHATPAPALKALCGEHGADVIFDPVGGPLAEAALRAVAWNGRHLVVGFTAGVPSLPLNLPLLKHASVIGCRWGAFSRAEPDAAARYIAELDALQASGKIKSIVTQTFPFELAPEAIAALGERRAIGKIVVTF
jgi:NADPH2:quinone reductase